MTTIEIPLKPFPPGSVAQKFGGPAYSAREVLVRARVALAPRGAWKKGSLTGKSFEGHSRCLAQAINDADGSYVYAAKGLLLEAAKEITGGWWESIEEFNDHTSTKKHHVIAALDLAIEKAS